MDLMLVLLAVAAFPVACLGFVLWMGVIEDSIPAGVRRSVRRPDPPPILAVPVRRTAAPEAADWWESVAVEENAAREGIPEQRTPPASSLATPALATPALPAPALPTPVLPGLPATEPLAGT